MSYTNSFTKNLPQLTKYSINSKYPSEIIQTYHHRSIATKYQLFLILFINNCPNFVCGNLKIYFDFIFKPKFIVFFLSNNQDREVCCLGFK